MKFPSLCLLAASIFIVHPLFAVEKVVSESTLTLACTGEWNNFDKGMAPAGFTVTIDTKAKTISGNSVLDELSESEILFHENDASSAYKRRINRISGQWEETAYVNGDISFTGSGTCNKVDKAKF